MKYALVQWTSGNLKTSILTEEYILDKAMLNDPEKEGMIVFVKPGEKSAVKHNVKAYLGRVKCVSDQKYIVELEQRLLLAEATMLAEATKTPRSSHSTQRNMKRPRSESAKDNYSAENNVKKPANDTTMPPEDNIRRSSTITVGATKEECNGTSDEASGSSAIQALEERITILNKELATEKSLVKELRKANLMLQNKLPEILRSAIQSSSVIHQLKTLCTCTCRANGLTAKPREGTKTSGEQTSSEGATTSEERATTSEERATTTKEQATTSEERATTSEERATTSEEWATTSEERAPSSEGQATPENNIPDKEDGNENPLNNIQIPPLCDLLSPIALVKVVHSRSYKKMTTAMLSNMFDISVIANSSVTGKSKAGRPALDGKIVDQIIVHVQRNFPETPIREIKATMAQKCKDTRMSVEKKNKSLAKMKIDEEKV